VPYIGPILVDAANRFLQRRGIAVYSASVDAMVPRIGLIMSCVGFKNARWRGTVFAILLNMKRATSMARGCREWPRRYRRPRRRALLNWNGSAMEFKDYINWHLQDPEGNDSTMLEIQAKAGRVCMCLRVRMRVCACFCVRMCVCMCVRCMCVCVCVCGLAVLFVLPVRVAIVYRRGVSSTG
jgi:hypothetical protein